MSFLCDLFGGHSTTVMDGFADACDLGGLHYTAMIVLADGTWGMSKYGTLSLSLKISARCTHDQSPESTHLQTYNQQPNNDHPTVT